MGHKSFTKLDHIDYAPWRCGASNHKWSTSNECPHATFFPAGEGFNGHQHVEIIIDDPGYIVHRPNDYYGAGAL